MKNTVPESLTAALAARSALASEIDTLKDGKAVAKAKLSKLGVAFIAAKRALLIWQASPVRQPFFAPSPKLSALLQVIPALPPKCRRG